jgi:hypothetical protein
LDDGAHEESVKDWRKFEKAGVALRFGEGNLEDEAARV